MRRGAHALLALACALTAPAAAHAQARNPATPQATPAPALQKPAAKPPTANPSSPTPAAQSTPGDVAGSNALGLAGGDNNKPLDIEAENGIEWQQTNRVYIARGHAKATRGDDSVAADTLYAYYRPAQPGSDKAQASAPATAKNSADQSPFENGSTQVYRIEADGNVVFSTPTQTAYGDHAIYDVDQALLVVTGKNLKIVTPQDIVTARDSLEWYDQKQIGVARGDAVAIRQGPEKKSIRGDILTAEVTRAPNQTSPTQASSKQASPDQASPNQGSKISRVDAQGHVILVSEDEIAKGDSGIYNLDTGIATLSGHVTLTRGQNVLSGQYAVVDTNKNVARLLSAPPSAQATARPPRVEGLLIPQRKGDQQQPGAVPIPGLAR
jgi:lipopolysaccharide export system protein LptA